jgi:hypothetical protein
MLDSAIRSIDVDDEGYIYAGGFMDDYAKMDIDAIFTKISLGRLVDHDSGDSIVWQEILASVANSPEFRQDDSITNYTVIPSDTDDSITDYNQVHEIYINNSLPVPDALFVMLPASFSVPSRYHYLLTTASQMGYHVIGLNYPDHDVVGEVCANSDDPNCCYNVRNEIVTGEDTSSDVDIDKADSIVNRLEKLLSYLVEHYPDDQWDKWLTSSGTVDWSNIIIAGHSQGGGDACFIGKEYSVKRVLLFASVEDTDKRHRTAPWISRPSATPVSRFYAFDHVDDVFWLANYNMWKTIGLDTDNMVNVDIPGVSLEGHHLFSTSALPSTGTDSGLDPHCSPASDSATPINSDGTPLYAPVWEAMIGTP